MNVRYGATLSFASRFGNHRFSLDCLILPKLIVSLPSHHIDVTQWKIPRNLPLALLQKTVLGYIICGKVVDPPPSHAVENSFVCTNEMLSQQLERFWEVDNFDTGKVYSPDEQHCEAHFQQTVERDQDGRYIVRLPLREEVLPPLGDSYPAELRRFLTMERKFSKDENLRKAYHDFIQEYEMLGHMEEVNPSASRSP
ncbi:uncharacterized protein LOC128735957 [Sabethes cyaneus]|uniref:uncharacterized protein LOC128735957 n=1 Tax=Sabethes cyaneus TaxID=53552 RepID=UPI00237E6013|nr:uncharacterized protein LOC128735957 [Sabethes cyaneus]